MVDLFRRGVVAPTALLTVLFALGASASSHADDTISDSLKRCTRIETAAERLSCFDELASRPAPDAASANSGVAEVVGEPQPTPAPVATPAVEPATTPAPASAKSDVAEVVNEPQPTPPPVATPTVEPATTPAPEPAPVAAKTLDDLAAETSPKATRKGEGELLVRAKVTRCDKDARKKYYFVFENGQVWKQTSDKRLHYRACEFEVTITKDFFGYKMQPDGEKGRIRIVRVK